jgi:hypothetical protein
VGCLIVDIACRKALELKKRDSASRSSTAAECSRPSMPTSPYGGKPRWLSGFDLCHLSAGATQFMQYIGADTIQRINVEYAAKCAQFREAKLRWRVSRGSRRSLGWVPFKAANLKRKGNALRFCGKTFRNIRASMPADLS